MGTSVEDLVDEIERAIQERFERDLSLECVGDSGIGSCTLNFLRDQAVTGDELRLVFNAVAQQLGLRVQYMDPWGTAGRVSGSVHLRDRLIASFVVSCIEEEAGWITLLTIKAHFVDLPL